MARAQLVVMQPPAMEAGLVVDRQGQVSPLPFLRLFVCARIGKSEPVRARDCILDTGAPLSVFPEIEWREFEDEIDWLPFSGKQAPPEWLRTPTGFAGGSCAWRVGTISVTVISIERGLPQFPPVRAIAQFLEDGNRQPNPKIVKRILLGLHGGILQSRRLSLEVDTRQAWLEEIGS